jgi:WD40 repeat protein
MFYLCGCLSLMGWLALGLCQTAHCEALGLEDKKPPASEEARTDSQGDPLPSAAIARLGTTRLRHIVRYDVGAGCLAFSPDGKTLVSGGDTGLCLWDMATGKELAWFREQVPASTAQFSQDGKTLITVDNQATIRYWRDGKSNLRQTNQSPAVLYNSWKSLMSANSKVVGVLDTPLQVRLWDVETGRQLLDWKDNNLYSSNSAALSPDGKLLAVRAAGNRARLLDVATGKEIRLIEGPTEVGHPKAPISRLEVESLAGLTFSRDGRLLAATWRDTFSLWEVSTGKLRYTANGGGRELLFSPDGKFLACAGAFEGTIRLFEAAGGKEVRRFERQTGLLWTLAFSPDGKTLAASEECSIRLWDVATGKRLHSFSGHETPVISLAFSPDGAGLASGDEKGGTLILWDLRGRQPRHLFRDHYLGVQSVAYSPDGKLIATGDGLDRGGRGGLDAQIRLWSAAEGKLLRQFPGHLNSVQHLVFSPDGKTLASAGNDARAKLWDVATGKSLHQLRGADALVRSVAFSPDGNLLAVARVPGDLAVWRVDSGQKVREFGAVGDERRAIGQATFLPDGKTILSREFRTDGRDGQQFRFWDTENGKELRSFGMNIPDSGNSCCALSPDCKSLATAPGDFRDCTIELRDATTGKIVGRLNGHTGGGVSALAFSPDGKVLASGGRDTTVLLWDVLRARLEHLWSELASGQDDAARAFKSLATTPRDVVPFLKQRLRRMAEQEARASGFISDLDDNSFNVREKASKELEDLGPDGVFALRLALQRSPSAERRARIQMILDKMKTADGKTSGFDPHSVWLSLAVLEEIGSPEAQQALQELGKGPAKSTIVREAGAALERLTQRRKIP